MGNKTGIKYIYMFDDSLPFIQDKKKFITEIKDVIERSFSKAKRINNYEILEGVKANLYYFENSNEYVQSIDNNVEQIQWTQVINRLFAGDDSGFLILCDYAWESTPQVRDQVYQAVKYNKNVIFACYSTVFCGNAQPWVLDLIKEQEREKEVDGNLEFCKIIKTAISMARKHNEMIRLLEEAILDEW